MVWNANQNHSKAERKAAEIASALGVRQAHWQAQADCACLSFLCSEYIEAARTRTRIMTI